MFRSCTIALFLLASGVVGFGSSADAAGPSQPEQRLSRITIRSVGTGSPVVLIPGLASPAAVFDDVAAKIGSRHRLILVQVNGFAGAAPGAAPLDGLIPGAVDELAGWLAANHIQKPPVIGHSMGGLMAMMLAKRHPEAAGRLMVVELAAILRHAVRTGRDARRRSADRGADARGACERRQSTASASAHVEQRRRQGKDPRMTQDVGQQNCWRSAGRGHDNGRTPGPAGACRKAGDGRLQRFRTPA